MNERNQNQVASHSNWPRVLLFDLAHRQCSGIIEGWLHCLKLESKGRFLVNNILMFGSAWCLVMAQIQFSLIKKNKDWTSITLSNSPPPPFPPLHSRASHFYLTYPPLPTSPQSGRHMCINSYLHYNRSEV